MRHESAKARARRLEATPWRQERVLQFPNCWICGTSPRHQVHAVAELNQVCVHEIPSNGGMRQRYLDVACATLVVCWHCNLVVEDRTEWPEARQLALILENSPEDYDLRLYLEMTSPAAPRRITQEEVDEWLSPKWGF